MGKLRHKEFRHLVKLHSSRTETPVSQSPFLGVGLGGALSWGEPGTVSGVLKSTEEEEGRLPLRGRDRGGGAVKGWEGTGPGLRGLPLGRPLPGRDGEPAGGLSQMCVWKFLL